MTQGELFAEWNRGSEIHCDRVCRYGNAGSCTHPEVQGRGMPVPVEQARAKNGPCGPEALFLTFRE